MKMTELFLAELDREAAGTRSALARVPEGHNDWKPHDKSMPLGNLANLCATMLSWIDMIINVDELDIAPKEGQQRPPVARIEKSLRPRSMTPSPRRAKPSPTPTTIIS